MIVYFIIAIVLLLLLLGIHTVFKEQFVLTTTNSLDKAHRYAVHKLCKDNGYIPLGDPDTGEDFNCSYDADTCFKLIDEGQPFFYHNSRCQIEPVELKEYCKENGMDYLPKEGRCVTTQKYCLSKLLPWNEETQDCEIRESRQILKHFIGDTFAKAVTIL